MYKKRFLAGLTAVLLLLSSLEGCSNTGSGSADSTHTSMQSTETSDSAESSKDTQEDDSTPAQSTGEASTEAPAAEVDARITVDGNTFKVGDKEIWINGANTPWISWNDFGGSINAQAWDKELRTLHESGINATRVWITCNGDVGIDIDENGYVTGATDSHWKSLDFLFTLAEKYHVYIMATLISFDHFKDQNKNYTRWRAMLNDDKAIDSYVENYVKPFCERYKDNDYLWSIDLCNEPDWIVENTECGQLPWDLLGSYFARASAAIHENSDILVTVGFGMVKYNSPKYNGDYGSDEYLQGIYDNPDAYLDFCSTHFYEWEATWYGNPFNSSPADFGLDSSKPCLLGEMPAVAMKGNVSGSAALTLTECYENLYANGWNGVMPWTSNGVDDCGDINDIAPAASAILEKAAEKIFPLNDRDLPK